MLNLQQDDDNRSEYSAHVRQNFWRCGICLALAAGLALTAFCWIWIAVLIYAWMFP